MIKYKSGILEKLKEAGYNSTKIRKEKIFGEKTVSDFRHEAEIPYKSLNQLCELLNCTISDVIEYVPDDER